MCGVDLTFGLIEEGGGRRKGGRELMMGVLGILVFREF